MMRVIEKALMWYLNTFMDREFPPLAGEPEIGKWYTVPIPGAVCSDGTPWRGTFRKGKENKLVVYFFGGGVSVNGYTAARPQGTPNGYYNPSVTQGLKIMENAMTKWGIGNQKKKNPFRDWSFIVTPYCNGDFHAGYGERSYRALDDSEKTIYYHGLKNHQALMDRCLQYIDQAPEYILITGGSAGGFGAALLTDDVVSRFPNCQNITTLVDSSLLLYGKWPATAADEWQSPKDIAEFLRSDNITLDALKHINVKYGERVKLLFDCSIRDVALAQTQVFFDQGIDPPEKPNCGQTDRFQANLRRMAEDMARELPRSGVFIWDDVADKENHLTEHTAIGLDRFFKKRDGGKSICDWLWDAVNGTVRSYGLDLLDKRY